MYVPSWEKCFFLKSQGFPAPPTFSLLHHILRTMLFLILFVFSRIFLENWPGVLNSSGLMKACFHTPTPTPGSPKPFRTATAPWCTFGALHRMVDVLLHTILIFCCCNLCPRPHLRVTLKLRGCALGQFSILLQLKVYYLFKICSQNPIYSCKYTANINIFYLFCTAALHVFVLILLWCPVNPCSLSGYLVLLILREPGQSRKIQASPLHQHSRSTKQHPKLL